MRAAQRTFVLDTAALVLWLLDEPKRPAETRRILHDPGSRFCVSAASILEIQYLIEIGRIESTIGEALSYIQGDPAFFLQPFDEIVLLETLEADGHRDPFDRIILATAKAYRLPSITRDRWMKKQYKNTNWS